MNEKSKEMVKVISNLFGMAVGMMFTGLLVGMIAQGRFEEINQTWFWGIYGTIMSPYVGNILKSGAKNVLSGVKTVNITEGKK